MVTKTGGEARLLSHLRSPDTQAALKRAIQHYDFSARAFGPGFEKFGEDYLRLAAALRGLLLENPRPAGEA